MNAYETEANRRTGEPTGTRYAWTVDDWTRMRRFLILGSEGGTYYASARKLTRENAQAVERCIAADFRRAMEMIVDVSHEGLAPSNDPALFALALAAASPNVLARELALRMLPRVARIGTHLFHFAAYVNGLRGWGPGLKKAIQRWYTNRSVESLALQLVKYQSRDGWSHRDLLRLAHPKVGGDHNMALRWAVKGAEAKAEAYPVLIEAAIIAQSSPPDLARLIRDHDLPREIVPTDQLNRVDVWEALLQHMPMGALVRNLGKLTALGILAPFSEWTARIAANLADVEQLRRARVHPVALLIALKVYAQGHGDKGKLAWKPVTQIIDALDNAFYLAFKTVRPANKKTLIAIDCSASMDWPTNATAGGLLTAREAAAAIAMVTAHTEPRTQVMGFSNRPIDLPISANQRLDDVCKTMRNVAAGSTNCSLPVEIAIAEKAAVDSFFIFTDNECNTGRRAPAEAMREYRERSGYDRACMAVMAFTPCEFSIADPNDSRMLDFAGFDSSAPTLLAEFSGDRL